MRGVEAVRGQINGFYWQTQKGTDSEAFGSIRKREPFPQGHENGQKKSTVAMMGGFCVSGIKKYPSEGVKCLEVGQLFR